MLHSILRRADVIVVGEKGLGSKEKFRLVEKLARVLHAAVGGSRGVVDVGWLRHHPQIGQTGKTVSPHHLYIAIGISGAAQHLAGMQTSKTIVAGQQGPGSLHFQSGSLWNCRRHVPDSAYANTGARETPTISSGIELWYGYGRTIFTAFEHALTILQS